MSFSIYKMFPEFTIYVDESEKDRGTSHIDKFVVEGLFGKAMSFSDLHLAIEWMWGGGGEGRTPYGSIVISHEPTSPFNTSMRVTRRP